MNHEDRVLFNLWFLTKLVVRPLNFSLQETKTNANVTLKLFEAINPVMHTTKICVQSEAWTGGKLMGKHTAGRAELCAVKEDMVK